MAESFLGQHGFSVPPLPSEQALAARRLVVAQPSLDDLLVRANLPPEESRKIQAMLDAAERTVAFRDDLPRRKRQWGALHEVGHEFIPWQREILYRCPLLWLPDHVQKTLEAEADQFAAEAFFFGGQFHGQAYAGDFSLRTAMELATDVYGTSFHATFAHYVEESPVPSCLLVWKPRDGNGSGAAHGGIEFHYYLKPRGVILPFVPDRTEDPDGVLPGMLGNPDQGVVEHEVVLRHESGRCLTASAESFSNSYNAFTLVRLPALSSFRVAAHGNGAQSAATAG